MKKALAILLCLALVGAGAFAGTSEYLSFSSWGRALWDVAGTSGEDIVSGVHQSWGGSAPRTSVTAWGGTDNVTYQLDLYNNGWTGIDLGDNAYIDIHPFGGMDIPFKMSWLMGKSDKNEARRDTTYGLWGFDRPGSVATESMEGFIFMDMLDVGVGTSIRLYPIEGLGFGSLTIAAALDFGDGSEDSWKELDYLWGNGNYYLNYKLPNNIGAISVGYNSTYYADDNVDNWGIVNAAFEFTMVDNLYVAIGAKIATLSEEDGGAAHQVNLYARYGFDGLGLPLNLHVLFGSKINAADYYKDTYDGFGFQVGLGVDYEVIENVPIFLDFRYANGVYMTNASAKNNDCITLGIGISKKWSNTELGVAFAMATNGYGYDYDLMNESTGLHGTSIYNSDGSRNSDLTWAIPVKFEYSF